MFLLDGKRLNPGTAFTHEDIQYPADWLNLSTPEEKEAIGIEEIAEQPRPDDRYYWVQDNNDGTFTATPKDLDQLKANAISLINAQANSLLSPSDYMTNKAIETGTEMDLAWKTWRQQIRLEAADAKVLVNSSENMDELISSSQVDWSKDPTHKE